MTWRFTGLFASKNFIFFVFFLSFFAFLAPNLFREPGNGLIGEEGYFYIGIAEQMRDDGFFVYDELSYGGRKYSYLFPWAAILYAPHTLFGLPLELLSLLLPYVLAVLSFLMVYFLLQSFHLPTERVNIGMLLLSISPPFLFMASTSNKYILPFFLSLLAFVCYQSKKSILKRFSFFFFLVLPFFSLTITFLALFLLLVYIYFYQKEDATFFWAICGSVILFSVLGIFFPIISTSPFLDLFSNPAIHEQIRGINPFFMTLLSDFGGKIGIGIFIFVLSLIGIFLLWLQRKKIGPIIISLLFLIFLSAKKVEPLLYLNVLAVLLAAFAIMEIAKFKWTSPTLKHFTIFVITCGMIFSSISYFNELHSSLPNKSILNSLTFIKEKTPLSSTVLSSYKNGHWIETLAKRKNVMDSYFVNAPDPEGRYRDSQTLFKTRNMGIAMEILKKYDVNYIYIDNAMKQDIWKYEEEGFLFLLKYSNNFKKVYLDDFVEIWRVEP